MGCRSNPLFMRRLGLFLALLGILLGAGLPWPLSESWAALTGDSAADPSQVRLLPAKSPAPSHGPILLTKGGPAIPDALPVLAPQDTPCSLASLAFPFPDATPTGAARSATVAQKASVLNRLDLQAHAPPAAH